MTLRWRGCLVTLSLLIISCQAQYSTDPEVPPEGICPVDVTLLPDEGNYVARPQIVGHYGAYGSSDGTCSADDSQPYRVTVTPQQELNRGSSDCGSAFIYMNINLRSHDGKTNITERYPWQASTGFGQRPLPFGPKGEITLDPANRTFSFNLGDARSVTNWCEVDADVPQSTLDLVEKMGRVELTGKNGRVVHMNIHLTQEKAVSTHWHAHESEFRFRLLGDSVGLFAEGSGDAFQPFVGFQPDSCITRLAGETYRNAPSQVKLRGELNHCDAEKTWIGICDKDGTASTKGHFECTNTAPWPRGKSQ